MPPVKKKHSINTVVNTESKSIDSFFATPLSNTIATITETETETDINQLHVSGGGIPVLPIEIPIEPPLTKANILSNLVQQKILFSHIDIKKKIDCLSENEITEIFKIIKNNNEKYRTNKNGIFVNVSILKKNTIQEISNFLYFCENNNKIIDDEELERTKYKEMIHNT